MKRAIETFLVAVTLPLWLPLSLAVAAAVVVAMGSPVLFRQERAGLGGRAFMMAKFRTMRDGQESDTERLTRTGRLLRATSLDELPQLWHVLSGKMSLVGPRPLPTKYLARYSKTQARRHETRPGITGWAQVNGRNAISWEKKFELDVWYVDHRSLLLDAKIIFMTVARVFRRSGIDSSDSVTMPEFMGQSQSTKEGCRPT